MGIYELEVFLYDTGFIPKFSYYTFDVIVTEKTNGDIDNENEQELPEIVEDRDKEAIGCVLESVSMEGLAVLEFNETVSVI